MGNKSCKFCNKGGLTWNYNGPIKKWELLESDGRKHRCLILQRPKPTVKTTPKVNFKDDPKIRQALQIFAKQLEREKSTVKRNYILGPPRKYKRS